MGGSKIGDKPEKKILNPQEKLAAINRVNERGESKASVARDLGIPESTLRGWCKNSLRINYQSNRSSPDSDDALKLSPTNYGSNKRKSLISSSNLSNKKRGRRPVSPSTSTNHLLMTTSSLTELNRLKAEYGLPRANDYLTQSTTIDSNSNSLDAAMRGWALQMQMLLQASMAISTTESNSITPLTTQGNISTSTLLTTSTSTTSSMINQLWAPLIDSSSINNSLYPSTITTPSTSSTLPLNLNFPTTSTTNLSQISSSSLLMSYLPNSLLDPTNLNPNPNATIPTLPKSPKFNINLSPHYQTPKCPWRTNSPTGYVQNFGSSASSSGSMSPKSRTSLNSQGFNDIYYGTDEETPILTNLSQSNEETSSDSLPVIPQSNQRTINFPQIEMSAESEPPESEPPQREPPQTESPQIEPPQIEPPQIEPPQIEPPKSEPSENSNKSSIEENETNQKSQGKDDDPSVQLPQKIESSSDGHRKNLESVLATVFQVTNNNNTIVSLDEEQQRSISISEAIECGEVFLKFLETAEDPNVTASQITQFRHILGNIKARCAQKNSEKKPKVSRK